MKKRNNLTLFLALLLGLAIPAFGQGKGNGSNGQGGGGDDGGDSNSAGLELTVFDYCVLFETACAVLSDDAIQGSAVYRDESLLEGDAGITLDFGRKGDFSGTFRASDPSHVRRSWVDIDSASCGGSFQGRLRFLRLDQVADLAPGEMRFVGAYAQIEYQGLIWNLNWVDGSVQAERDDTSGVRNVFTKDAESVEIQRPGNRKKWETCDSAATVHFDVNISRVQP